MDNDCNISKTDKDDIETSENRETFTENSVGSTPESPARECGNATQESITPIKTDDSESEGKGCVLHGGAEVNSYCSQCHTAVCDVCMQTDHEGHRNTAMSGAMSGDKASLTSLVSTIKEAIPRVDRAIQVVEDTQCQLIVNTESAKIKINSLFDELAFLVEQRKQAALRDLAQNASSKENVLKEQKRALMEQLNCINSCCELAAAALAGDCEADVAMARKNVTEKLNDLLSNHLVLQAETNPLVFFEPRGVDSLREMISNAGVVVNNTAVPYHTTASGDAFSGCVAGKPSLVTVTTRDRNVEPVKTGFAALTGYITSDKQVEKLPATVTDQQDGTYDISFVLPEPGVYYLSVFLFDQHIKGSPYKIRARDFNESNGTVSTRSSRTLTVKEHRPKRSSSSRSHGSCCRSLNRVEDDLIMRVGVRGRNKGEFSNPQGVCCHDDKVIVADSNNQSVQIFSSSGECLLKFGTPGSGPGRIQRPTGVAVTHTGNYLVADYDNKWICEFNSEGRYVSHIGAGRLQGPKGVAVDNQGRIIVVDNKCNSVLVFLANGKFVNRFGCRGNWEEQLAGPHYAAVNEDDDVIVSDFHNHCVKVYDCHGQFKFSFGSNGEGNGQFNAPTGVAVDSRGNMLVADWGNSRIQVFDSNGSFLSFVNTASDPIYGPQGLAVASQGVLVVADAGNHCIKYYKYLQ